MEVQSRLVAVPKAGWARPDVRDTGVNVAADSHAEGGKDNGEVVRKLRREVRERDISKSRSH